MGKWNTYKKIILYYSTRLVSVIHIAESRKDFGRLYSNCFFFSSSNNKYILHNYNNILIILFTIWKYLEVLDLIID
jgi:hypothetical protein